MRWSRRRESANHVNAAVALLALVRAQGSGSRQRIEPALRRALATVRSYSGTPDVNTVRTLTLALSQLGTAPLA